ncbi:MAG: hypothetical protein RL594_155 [Bacteroidota bacterium]|jgi:hypothetical protein
MLSRTPTQFIGHSLVIVVMMIALAGCAMKVAPTGGPRDETPAEVIQVDPPSGTASFQGNRVAFTFDDYVDRSIRNAITILPSARFSTSYAGDEISVEFTEPLAPNTTYTITLGTEWTDIRGNRPLSAFTTVLATGPMIDTGVISGVVAAPSLTNVVVFCYPRADTLGSAFTPWKTAPRYQLPTGKSGAFSIKGLADGLYRVIAVRDDNRNGLIDPREDFGVAPFDVRVDSGRAPLVNLVMGPFIDTDRPMLTRVRSLNARLLSVQFTEYVEPVRSWQDALTIESATQGPIRCSSVWSDLQQRDLFFVRLAQPLDTSQTTITLQPGALRDSAGNISADTSSRRAFRGSATSDTATLRVLRIDPPDSTKGVSREQPITVFFSDAVDTMNAQISIEHRSLKGAAQVRTRWASPVQFVIEPQEQRQLNAWYTTSMQFIDLRSTLGRTISDSAREHHVLTIERPADPGTVTGVVVPSAAMMGIRPLVVRLLGAKGVVVATFQPNPDGTFTLDAVPPGEYTFDVFGDTNRNGRHEYGSIQPFKFGEPWWPLPTKITVRPRWTLENVRIAP